MIGAQFKGTKSNIAVDLKNQIERKIMKADTCFPCQVKMTFYFMLGSILRMLCSDISKLFRKSLRNLFGATLLLRDVTINELAAVKKGIFLLTKIGRPGKRGKS